MKDIMFQQPGGFPFETDTLDKMQKDYKSLQVLGELSGDKTIVKGCNEVGNNITDGYIYYNGELIRFKGGVKQTYIIIVENIEQGEFEDGSIKDIYKDKWAQFGSDVNQMLWSEFKRPKPLLVLTQKLTSLEERLNKTVPIGLVAVWDRPFEQIPEGWVEHIELRGVKPLGHNPDELEYSVLGKTIGAKSHTLSKLNIPKIKLKWKKTTGVKIDSWNGRDNLVYSATDYHSKNKTTVNQYPLEDIGRDIPNAINHLDPSRIVKFIRFVGFN